MITLLATALVIGVIVFVHELGHYLAARSVGVRVERFSIGFPPRFITMTSVPNGWEFKLFFFRKNDESGREWGPVYEKHIARPGRKGSLTEYCFAIVPLGGYVKMAGLIDESLDSKIEHKPYELMSKPRWAQAWVMSAGVIMNVVLALVIFSVIFFNQGKPIFNDEPVIAQLVEGQPAELAGMQVGDRITSINGKSIETWNEITEIIHASPNSSINLEYEREGQFISIEVTTLSQEILLKNEIDTIGVIGIARSVNYESIGIFEAIKYGGFSTLGVLELIGTTLKLLITGEAGLKDIGGPILIAQMAGEAAKMGITPLFSFMALISVNLALINILPIPVLDGGHLLIITSEAIIRKPLNVKLKLIIQQIGMVFLMLLMALIIWNDIARKFIGE